MLCDSYHFVDILLQTKEYRLQQEEAPSGRFPLGLVCNQAAQAASADFCGKGSKASGTDQGGPKWKPCISEHILAIWGTVGPRTKNMIDSGFLTLWTFSGKIDRGCLRLTDYQTDQVEIAQTGSPCSKPCFQSYDKQLREECQGRQIQKHSN